MESAGLVTRRRDPANRRLHLVELTPAGDALFLGCGTPPVAFDRRLRAGLSDGEVGQLDALLTGSRQRRGLRVVSPANQAEGGRPCASPTARRAAVRPGAPERPSGAVAADRLVAGDGGRVERAARAPGAVAADRLVAGDGGRVERAARAPGAVAADRLVAGDGGRVERAARAPGAVAADRLVAGDGGRVERAARAPGAVAADRLVAGDGGRVERAARAPGAVAADRLVAGDGGRVERAQLGSPRRRVVQ